ncbi:unnamed protein product, partial [marine sediment metagenome]
ATNTAIILAIRYTKTVAESNSKSVINIETKNVNNKNLPFNLISGLSDFNDSLENQRPGNINTIISTA